MGKRIYSPPTTPVRGIEQIKAAANRSQARYSSWRMMTRLLRSFRRCCASLGTPSLVQLELAHEIRRRRPTPENPADVGLSGRGEPVGR